MNWAPQPGQVAIAPLCGIRTSPTSLLKVHCGQVIIMGADSHWLVFSGETGTERSGKETYDQVHPAFTHQTRIFNITRLSQDIGIAEGMLLAINTISFRTPMQQSSMERPPGGSGRPLNFSLAPFESAL
jgi:hypothetical protein